MRHKIAIREGRAFQVCLATFRTGEHVGEIEGTGIERIARRVQDQDGVCLGLWKGLGWVWLGLCKERTGFGWGRGPLANKVWIQPRSIAGSVPQS